MGSGVRAAARRELIVEDAVTIPKVRHITLGQLAIGLETNFFNWYNPIKAYRVVMVSKKDPVILWRVKFRLVWWNPSQIIPSVIKHG